MKLLNYRKINLGTFECKLDLNGLYQTDPELSKFDERWNVFLNSDQWNKKVLKRNGNTITYLHKSWVPEKVDERIPVLILAGNPAPHSTFEGVYYAYEKKGFEHRFWKILLKLGFIDLPLILKSLKSSLFDLIYSLTSTK